MIRKVLVGLISAAVLTGCYVEALEDERVPEFKKNPGLDAVSADDCTFTKEKGCLQGQVPAAPNLVVNGQEFFDANDLGQRFFELIDVDSLEGEELARGEDYELTLTKQLRNTNFSSGFQVYLKGDEAHDANVSRQGRFRVDNLDEGTYDVRVQKTIAFTAERALAKQEQPETAEEAGGSETAEEADASVTKQFCSTLYADATIEVKADTRTTAEVFDDFTLQVRDLPCESKKDANPSITL